MKSPQRKCISGHRGRNAVLTLLNIEMPDCILTSGIVILVGGEDRLIAAFETGVLISSYHQCVWSSLATRASRE